MSTARIANRTIPLATDQFDLLHADGETKDIINVILEVHQKYKGELSEFAKHFRGSTQAKIRKVWEFVHKNISYEADQGESLVKSPAQTYKDKVADCKSMSLFVGALLHHLQIPFVYRFAGYPGTTDVKHIYVVAIPGNSIYMVDPTLPMFDQEAPNSFIVDYDPDTGEIVDTGINKVRIRGANKNIFQTVLVAASVVFIISLINNAEAA